jgi:hypothetical protein
MARISVWAFSGNKILGAEPFRDVRLKLVSQNSEVWIAPDRTLSIFYFVGPNALHDEVVRDPVFLEGRRVAESSALAVPLAVVCHGLPNSLRRSA